ncbi:hypothetical protein PLESTM_000987900 [Pleodorina starrii]|nr:hypothetical protein PLESTM_000987900 [Pleodorina starrii]
MLPSEFTVESLPDLLALSRLYKVSATLNAAAKLDVFTVISRYPEGASLQQLSEALGLCRDERFRAGADFLDLLVSVAVLERTGEGPDALYRNSPLAEQHLVRGRPNYAGGILCLNSARSFPMFEYLGHALQHGRMPPEAFQRVPDIHTTFGSDVAAAEFFAEGMTGASLANFEALAERFPFGRFASLARRHAHISAATYDLPPVHAAAERYVRQQGCEGRVQVRDYDFFSSEAVPAGHDVLTYGMVLHDWGIDKKLLLMRKAFESLPAGGALIAIDHLIDDTRRRSPVQLGMSLCMLLEFGTENAFDYSFKEFREWAGQVGFSSVELIQLVGTAKAAVAYK